MKRSVLWSYFCVCFCLAIGLVYFSTEEINETPTLYKSKSIHSICSSALSPAISASLLNESRFHQYLFVPQRQMKRRTLFSCLPRQTIRVNWTWTVNSAGPLCRISLTFARLALRLPALAAHPRFPRSLAVLSASLALVVDSLSLDSHIVFPLIVCGVAADGWSNSSSRSIDSSGDRNSSTIRKLSYRESCPRAHWNDWMRLLFVFMCPWGRENEDADMNGRLAYLYLSNYSDAA